MNKATIFTFLFSALFLLNFSIVEAQLFEDFESGTKGGYAPAVVTLSTGNWYLAHALLGTDNNDQKIGGQSVRLDNRTNQANLQMNFDFPDGANEINFYAGKSNFSGDQSANSVISIQYSTNSGSNWTELEQLTVPSDLTQQTVEVAQGGPIRFRILTISGQRMNIDNFYIDPYTELDENPTVQLRRGNEILQEGGSLQFPSVGTGGTRTIDLQIRNNGVQNLDVTSIELSNDVEFSIVNSENAIGSYESTESKTFSVTFTPQSTGEFSSVLTINSNDPETAQYTLNLSGDALSEDDITPIEIARELEFGTRVTIAGRVTVANEFEGPVFLQDQTAGIAVYFEPMHPAVQRGDSVIVTGPITEFNPIGSNHGTFLVQIAAHDGDTDITFDIIDTEPVIPEPVVISVQGMNGGNFESQLVQIQSVVINHSGAFQGNVNYSLSDQTGEGEIRIDNSTDLVGATAPDGPTDIVGVVDRFNGVYQIKPRDLNDLDAEPIELVGEDISKDLTFDVVTWNIEWFGSSGNGPDDLDLQTNNVLTVIRTIDADLYALQEIANSNRFYALVDSLDEYSGFMAHYASQQQNTAYLFKTAVIDSLDSGLLTTNQQEFDWAFRLPLFFEFNATVNGITRNIHSYNVHAKALADQDSYNRRSDASATLKLYLDNNKAQENVIFIGDYNDFLTKSSFDDLESPYSNFVNDPNYYPVTLSLENRGFTSYIAGQNRSMIDHITVTNDLIEDHINGAERVENPSYIGSYISTTSDHVPVWSRFDFSRSLVSINDDTFTERPDRFEVHQNYPNPFNPTTNLQFTLAQSDEVSIRVYDVMGREVARLLSSDTYGSGTHTVTFDASNLSSGVYFYRVTLGSGQMQTGKMMLVK